jgi:hypothetical protein
MSIRALKSSFAVSFGAVLFLTFAACNDRILDDCTGGDSGGGVRGGIDTLCIYEHREGPSGARVFQNNDHLTAFLHSTGYDESLEWGIRRKISHQPDFKKWSYFAFAGGLDWRYPRKVDLLEGKDTITVNYTILIPPTPLDNMCPLYAPPVSIVNVYFIPFTEKTIKWTETLERLACVCGRH